jgi:hypothetical protein
MGLEGGCHKKGENMAESTTTKKKRKKKEGRGTISKATRASLPLTTRCTHHPPPSAQGFNQPSTRCVYVLRTGKRKEKKGDDTKRVGGETQFL